MVFVFALLLAVQVSSPSSGSSVAVPAIDEGWVIPTEISDRASSVCPRIGRVTAEFTLDRTQGGGRRFKVVGMGRSSSAKDEETIDLILRPLRGWDHISVSCWGEQAAHITVFGPVETAGRFQQGRADFLWSREGPAQLSENAIYPSVSKLGK